MNLKNYNRIHCVGIGGIGLSAIAEILVSRGVKVSGSDIRESESVRHLKDIGVDFYLGHDAENLTDAQALIFSAAVSPENPEISEAIRRGIPVLTRAEALGMLMGDYEVSVAVSGTHGKTTTTSMVSLILDKAGLSPTILVGGVLSDIKGNVKVGNSEYFVTEACEYMDSFLQLRPQVEIILNIDSDHLDYFKDIDHITESFRKFAELVPPGGSVIAYDSNPFVKSVCANLKSNVVTFGFSSSSDFYASKIEFDKFGHPSYDLFKRGERMARIQLSVPGEHNVANSLAAIAACDSIGVSLDAMIPTLENFKGTQRRFDIVGNTEKGATVVDDYAHHPTEIKATLSAARNVPHKRLWCLFQPHTYTRTMALMQEFAESFEDADVVVFAEIYPAREKNIYKISSAELRDRMKLLHPEKEVYFIPTFEEIKEFVCANTEEGDLIFTMGAGDIYKIGEEIVKS